MKRIVVLTRRLWFPLTLVAIMAIILLLIWPGWAYQWDWTGFGWSFGKPKDAKGTRDFYPSKRLWDWLQLLIVPLAVAGAAAGLSWAQQRRERIIAQENRRLEA